MRRWSMWSINKPLFLGHDIVSYSSFPYRVPGICILALAAGLAAGPWSAHAALAAKTPDREPVMLSVVAVNPSADKTQVIPVKIELPQEVTPSDVLDTGELQLEYDEDRQAYFVYKDAVALAPKETRVFEVTVRDVWHIPKNELNSLRDYTSLVMERLQKTEYAATAKELADSILKRLNGIETTQNDDRLSRKSRIGAYRYHLQDIAAIKEDLARMEKLLTFVGGPPVPELLEDSPLKSDAPSRTTTWLVIFLIVIFVGLLGGQFFFTWHRRAQVTQDLAVVRQVAFPTSSGVPSKGPGAPAAHPQPPAPKS